MCINYPIFFCQWLPVFAGSSALHYPQSQCMAHLLSPNDLLTGNCAGGR